LGLISSGSSELVMNLQVALTVNNFFAEWSLLDFQKGLYTTVKPEFMYKVCMFLSKIWLSAYTKVLHLNQSQFFPNGMLLRITQK
jgi:hypothetical protein